MNIFLLCAGKGSRFESILPKPLNLINGKPMIHHTIASLNLHRVPSYQLYVVYNRKLEQCNFKEVLSNMFPSLRFRFILLDYFTRGASESAYMGLQSALLSHATAAAAASSGADEGCDGHTASQYDAAAHEALLNGNIVFLDNDTVYPSETWQYLSQQHDSNFIFSNFNNEKEPVYSYLRVDQDNFVQDIKEKQKISDLICVGGYGFRSKDDFISTFHTILATNSKTNNEFYMSLIFEVLLGRHVEALPASPVDEEMPAVIQEPTAPPHRKDYTTLPVSPVRNITINKIISMGTPQQLMNEDSIKSQLRYVFDLDNTLVSYPTILKDYSSVKPIPKMIELVQKLKADGHTIIIHTARRMATHHNNVGAVIKDIGRVTMDTLDKFSIPYDELIFGKPLGDVYIDDRAYNPFDDRLFHLLGEYSMIDDDIDNKLANNKYNSIRGINQRIIKSVDKLIGAGELFFYESLQSHPGLRNHDCRHYFVQYFGYKMTAHQIELSLEKIKGIPLAYLYINQTFSAKLLKKLLLVVKRLHNVVLDDSKLPVEQYALNYTKKLETRFEKVEHYSFTAAQSMYDTIQQRLRAYVSSASFASNVVSLIHGDCWFSNILITYRDEFKLIDMKGLVNGVETLSGDKLYDYAKVLQSLVGFDAILYDKEVDASYTHFFIGFLQQWLRDNEPAVLWTDLCTVTACLVFGVFHAYAEMSAAKRDKIVRLVQTVLELGSGQSALRSSVSYFSVPPVPPVSHTSTSDSDNSVALSHNNEQFHVAMQHIPPLKLRDDGHAAAAAAARTSVEVATRDSSE